MHVKVNLRVAEGEKTPGRRGLTSESWKIGHQKPVSLAKLLVDTCLVIAKFWYVIECGHADEMNVQVHKAADELAIMEWREEPSDETD